MDANAWNAHLATQIAIARIEVNFWRREVRRYREAPPSPAGLPFGSVHGAVSGLIATSKRLDALLVAAA